MTPTEEVARRIMLVTDVYVTITAIIHFAKPHLGGFRWSYQDELGWKCDSKGAACSLDYSPGVQALQPTWSNSIVDPSLVVAIVSSVILVTRIVMMRLNSFSRCASLFYDLILLSLWTMTMVKQICKVDDRLFQSEERSWLSFQQCGANWKGNTEGIDQFLRDGSTLSALAVVLYSSRLLVEIVGLLESASRMGSGGNTRGVPQDDEYCDVDELGYAEAANDVRDKAYSDALSPVLAFFPEHDE